MANWWNRWTPTLRDQMLRSSNGTAKTLHTLRVTRVLNILSDGNLTAVAALADRSERTVVVECPDATYVWNDHRIAARLKELGNQGVKVERTVRQISTVYADMERPALRITF